MDFHREPDVTRHALRDLPNSGTCVRIDSALANSSNTGDQIGRGAGVFACPRDSKAVSQSALRSNS